MGGPEWEVRGEREPQGGQVTAVTGVEVTAGEEGGGGAWQRRGQRRGMADDKSPGSDGLLKEFYFAFSPVFGRAFVAMINRCYRCGVLPESLWGGLITLLCKDQARREHLRCWGPLTLLNVDHKIVSKAVCRRMSRGGWGLCWPGSDLCYPWPVHH